MEIWIFFFSRSQVISQYKHQTCYSPWGDIYHCNNQPKLPAIYLYILLISEQSAIYSKLLLSP